MERPRSPRGLLILNDAAVAGISSGFERKPATDVDGGACTGSREANASSRLDLIRTDQAPYSVGQAGQTPEVGVG